jgi:hypothetical protein
MPHVPHLPQMPLPNRQVVLRLEVTLGSDGSLNVNGPVENKVACLGLLELAKQAVLSYDSRQVAAAPVGIDLSNLRSGN